MPVQESSQSRRVVVSHNVDKALKEGNGSYFSNDSPVFFIKVFHSITQQKLLIANKF